MSETTGHVDPTALERSLRGLRVSVESSSIDDAIREVLEAACLLFGISGTGLMVIDEDRALRYVAATDRLGRQLEEVQDRAGVGPCVDALVFDAVVQSRNLSEDDRWPEIRDELVQAGICAVLGVPVHLGGDAVASLDGYMDRPYEWDASHIRALQAYADLVGSLLGSAVQARQRGEIADQLQHALDSRVTIERAVGMLMGLEDVDAVSAFNRLRGVARDRREKVADVAEEVLAGRGLAAKPPAS